MGPLHRLLGLAFASVAAAQTTWSMGSPWTDLATVLAAAAPGDVVLLNGLTFPPIDLTKGLTILGPGTIATTLALPNVQSTLTIPPGERAHLVDVDFQPLLYLGVVIAGQRVVADGDITFENCTFRAGAPSNLLTAGAVMLHRCTVTGNAATFWPQSGGGMVVHSGFCSLVDCTVDGGNSLFCGSCPNYFLPATAALRVVTGTVVASNTVFSGGSGAVGGVFGTSAGTNAVQTSGTAYFTDCTIQAGSTPGGSAPAPMVANATTFFARTLLGAATTPQSNLPQLVGMQLSQGLRLGQTSTITATSGGANLLGILAGFDGAVGSHPVVIEPVLAPVSQLITLTIALPSPGSAVSRALAVPSAPALVGLAVYVQALQLDGLTVRASAPVGSVVR